MRKNQKGKGKILAKANVKYEKKKIGKEYGSGFVV